MDFLEKIKLSEKNIVYLQTYWIFMLFSLIIVLQIILLIIVRFKVKRGFLDKKYLVFTKNIFYLTVLLVLIYFCCYLYILFNQFINDWDLLTWSNLKWFFVIHVSMIINTLAILIKETKKYAYFVYLLQLLTVFIFNYQIIFDFMFNSFENFLFISIVIYCVLVLGYWYLEKLKEIFNSRTLNGTKRQNDFYEKTARKYRWLNNFAFWRNVLTINLGSLRETETNYFYLYFFLILFNAFIIVLSYNLCFKLLFSIAITSISILKGYETLYENYRESSSFRKNFNLNARYWNILLKKKENSIGNFIIKRSMGQLREQIHVSIDNVGSITMKNTSTRTLVGITVTTITLGTVAVSAYVYVHYLDANTKIEVKKIMAPSEEANARANEANARANEANARANEASARANEAAEKAKLEKETRKSNKLAFEREKWRYENENKSFWSKRFF